jgi:hypothetical protein
MLVKTEKVKVASITITRAEGLSKLCGKPQVYLSWEDARIGMLRMNSTYPKAGQGYDKHDLRVVFENGETYSGRMDVKQIDVENNDQDPLIHVREMIQFYTGKHRPYWMKPEQYEQALIGVNRQEYVEYLEMYDV